jgi:two-component system response regulator AtoC
MISYSIYLVDDDQMLREGVTLALERSYQVKAFSTADTAIEAIKKNPPDLVLLDIALPGINGIEALGKIKNLNPGILVIMMTASDDINTVISSMKLGAYDYVVKPIHMDALEVTIQNAFEAIKLRKEVETLQEKYLTENLPCFIGESNVIQDVMQFVGMVAKSPDTPILILGETGTGKELIASAIHYRSPNFKGPFITVNCAAIPKDLIESELFGYERGAFTGARSSGKTGLIEEATNGTLFLDEVGDLNLESQSKLLRFLEEGEFYRIGGTKKFKIKTRVVSATNRDIDKMIAEGLFRKDLYFRLGVIKVEIPSLNDRPEDIIPIARHFLVAFSRKIGKTFTSISPIAEDALKNFRWQGNIRELKNVIERGVLIGNGPELTLQGLGIDRAGKDEMQKDEKSELHFPPLSPAGVDLLYLQNSLEKYYIEEALKMADGNETKAAKFLNINHHTFRYRKRKLQIP